MNTMVFIENLMLITITFFTVLSLLYRKNVAGFLSLLIAGSVFSAFLIGLRLDEVYLFEVLFVNFILFLIVVGFNKYKVIEFEKCKDTMKYEYIYKYIKIFAAIGIIVNLILIGSSFRQYISLATSINAFKNQGIAVEFIYSGRLSFLTTLSLLFSPFSYLTLGYHFYFLYKGDRSNAIKSIILSMGIFLPNLVYLSRAGAVTFILMYLSYWYYIKNVFTKGTRKRVRKIVLRILAVVILILLLISQNRFSNSTLTQELSLISNPVFYSILWYFSQWFTNGLFLISRYNSSMNLSGSSFSYIVSKFKELFGVEVLNIKILRETAFGSLANHFNGLPAVMIYDLGYLGTLLFCVIFLLIVKKFTPKKGRISLNNFLVFSVLIPMPIMFFQGNHFTSSVFNLAIIYTILLRIITKHFIKLR